MMRKSRAYPYNLTFGDIMKSDEYAIDAKLNRIRELGVELSNSNDYEWIPIIKELDRLKDEILDLSYSLATGERP